MKKEVIAAISIGVSIGLIFTYGIYVANKSLKKSPIENSDQVITSIKPSPSPMVEMPKSKYNLTNLENYQLVNTKTFTLSGTRDPQNPVIILGESSQFILPATSSSNFSITVPLDAGYNRLRILWANTDIVQNLLVTYSNNVDLFKTVSTTTTSTPNTPSDNSTLRNSVQEKINEAIAEIKKNSRKSAYLGKIVTLSDATITISSYDGTSLPVTTTAETTIKLKNNSEGSFKDLKKDDYLLVLGDADTSHTLSAKRILVIDPPDLDDRKIKIGTVKSYTNKTLTVDDVTLNITKDTLFQPSKYKFKDIDPGFKLIAVYTSTSTPLIYVVSEK